MDVGPPELLIILIIALVLFGGAKLPQLAKGLGQAKNEYEKAMRGEGDDTPAEPASQPQPALPANPTVPLPGQPAMPVATNEAESAKDTTAT